MLSVSCGSVVQSRSSVVVERVLLVVVEADREPVGREDRQAGVLQRDQAHQHVVGARAAPAGRRARSRSGGGRRRSAARCRCSAALKASIASASSIRQSLWTVPSSSVTVPQGSSCVNGSTRAPGRVGRVVVEAEDRREVRARGAREPQPVLLRARVRALVRADAAGAVVLDACTRAKTPWRVRSWPSGPGVVLRERPQRGRRRRGRRSPRRSSA